MGVHSGDVTPNRLYSIGNTYQLAAATVVASPDFGGYATDAPARTLFYHAVELYLKAFLLLAETGASKIVLPPDLEKLLEHSITCGLSVSQTTEKFVRSAARDRGADSVRDHTNGDASTSLKLLVRAVIEVRAQLRAKLLAQGIEPAD